jgi:WD40 repeat protein
MRKPIFQRAIRAPLELSLRILCAILVSQSAIFAQGVGSDAKTPIPQSAALNRLRPDGSWSATGSLRSARDAHTATRLLDGRVLVTGGQGDTGSSIGTLKSTELYDPEAGVWTPAADLTTARIGHTATLLPNGEVLVIGGAEIFTGASKSTEIYNPATGMWRLVGELGTARAGHTATLLPDGRVLVAGGTDFASCELYNPSTGTSTATGSFAIAQRINFTATLLPNGKVLAVGGAGADVFLDAAELYDPATGKWTLTGNLRRQRARPTATLLSNGKVLVVGGEPNFPSTGGAPPPPETVAEIYDPATGGWTAGGNPATARQFHTATLLANGKVVVAGGASRDGRPVATEFYSPESNSWSPAGVLVTGRDSHTATLLADGRVLAAGGLNGAFLSSSEIYDPTSSTFSISGRVLSPTGAALRNVVIVLTDASGARRLATTSSFGTYSFADLTIGRYVLLPTSKRYRFSPNQLEVGSNLAEVNFVGHQ